MSTQGRERSRLGTGRRMAARIFLRNKLILSGLIIFLIMMVQALGANWISPYEPFKQNYRETLQGPSWKHPFGTDRFGRDILSREIYGARISLRVAVISIFAALVVGGMFGLVAGYFGGWIDLVISRSMDIFFSFPAMFLAIALAAMLGNGEGNATLAIAIVYMPLFARIIRGSVPDRAGAGVCHGLHGAGGINGPDHFRSHSAQCHLAHGGAGGDLHVLCDSHRSGAELPGTGDSTAHPLLGDHAERRQDLSGDRPLDLHFSGTGHHAGGAGVQPHE